MKIKSRVALGFLAVAGTTIALFYFAQRPKLLSEFERLQTAHAKEDLGRARDAVLTQLEALSRQSQDWASWDDTYKYVQDHNATFAKANLAGSVFTTTHFDLIFIIDQKGEIVFGKSQLPGGKIVDCVPGLELKTLALGDTGTPGPAIEKKCIRQGVEYLAQHPAIISVRPILDSAESKPPRGALIVGRYLAEKEIKAMRTKSGVDFDLLGPIAASGAIQFDPAAAELANSPIAIAQPKIGQKELGYTYLTDPMSRNSILVRSASPPDILEQGTQTISRTFQSIIWGSLAAAIIGLLGIHKGVVAPLQGLTTQVQKCDDNAVVLLQGEVTTRSDEIGILGRNFNELMTRLDTTKARLSQASREAGMAEVARGVLHNAGNVLNSVTVSVRQVELLATRMNPSGLGKAITLLNDNQGNLDSFLATDPRGMKLVPYLKSLSENLESGHEELLAEGRALAKSTNHLGQVVQGQAVFATKPNVQSKFRLAKVVQEMRVVLEKGLERHGVQLLCDVDDEIFVTGDPSQLLQVLVNLVTNAKDAMKCQPLNERTVSVTTVFSDNGELELQVKDNGHGVKKEDQETIFSQGFTTKEKGLGFGLHYCANAATEMGWTIGVVSEGDGRGATFILTTRGEKFRSTAA